MDALNKDQTAPPPVQTVKCVVWDLDNTIWHGTLAENDDLKLRENIGGIIKALDERGILNTIASRNNHDDALRKLAEFGLAEYFLYPQIHWGRKSDSVKAIKEKLNIGYDAIAFIDDQEFEREEVLFAHPAIRCFPAESLDELLTLDVFKVKFMTSETAKRRLMYQLDQKRDEEEANYSNNLDFLKSLKMKFIISKATRDDLQRIEELTVRTNQLNATGYTYSYETLEQMLGRNDLKIFVAELEDKFGMYGKIGVSLIDCSEPDHWRLKLLLMSCRVMSRGVGSVFLNFLITHAAAHDKKLLAEFLPTDRNRLMYVTFRFSGFNESGPLEGGGTLLEQDPSVKVSFPEYVELITSGI